MKQLKIITASFLALLLFTFSQCKKKTEEPRLPPETTTGAMTFGCKVNGKVFVPKDGRGRPGLFVQYVNLGTGPRGGWYLNISTYDYSAKKGIHIETDSLLLAEGVTYNFKKEKGYPLIFYEEVVNGTTEIYGKQIYDTGSLYITKHDQINRVLSGTFFFTGTKISDGQKVNVTDGRFDLRY